jgi:hypothetical protein
VQLDTKIAVILREDLAGWQATNVTAFLVSGTSASVPGSSRRARTTRTGPPWRPVAAEDLDLVGIAFRAERKTVDKVVDRLRFHP